MKQVGSLGRERSALSITSWVGVGVAVTLLLVYVATLMPGVPPTDSGELILAAWSGGVAHAPGFPLYTALGWLWSHLLPVGRIAWRLNLLSAVCGALAGGLTYALALRTLREGTTTSRHYEHRRGGCNRRAGAGPGPHRLDLGDRRRGIHPHPGHRRGDPAAGGGERRRRGDPAEEQRGERPRAEEPRRHGDSGKRNRIRNPNGRFAVRNTPHAVRTTHHAPRSTLILAAFLFGLGLGGHLTSIALLAPGIAFWLTARHGWRFWISKTALLAALALIGGAAIYLYLPVRAAADPLLNWGRPDTWQRFWWHVTAKQYRVSLLSAPVWPQVVFAARLWWTQFTPVGLALLGVGAWRMMRSQRALFVMLALIVLFSTLYAWAYVIEDDGDAYYLPAFLAGAVWVAWGAQGLLAKVGQDATAVAATGGGRPLYARARRGPGHELGHVQPPRRHHPRGLRTGYLR